MGCSALVQHFGKAFCARNRFNSFSILFSVKWRLPLKFFNLIQNNIELKAKCKTVIILELHSLQMRKNFRDIVDNSVWNYLLLFFTNLLRAIDRLTEDNSA